MAQNPAKVALDLLDFYTEAGVDAMLGEEPVDCFAAGEAAPPAPRPTHTALLPRDLEHKGRVAPQVAPLAPDEAAMATAQAAKSAKTLDELRPILDRFNGCGLKATATQLVFADGNPQAGVMFVGEAPGRDEDIEGLPFVGRSGKLLDRMLAAIGLDRTKVYIANIVPWRPPGNRTPTPQESQICLPFILRQIELADPDILLCLGRPAAPRAARHDRRHPQVPRPLACLSYRQAGDPGHRQLPPVVPAALAARK